MPPTNNLGFLFEDEEDEEVEEFEEVEDVEEVEVEDRGESSELPPEEGLHSIITSELPYHERKSTKTSKDERRKPRKIGNIPSVK
jgi:hypothetical protein